MRRKDPWNITAEDWGRTRGTHAGPPSLGHMDWRSRTNPTGPTMSPIPPRNSARRGPWYDIYTKNRSRNSARRGPWYDIYTKNRSAGARRADPWNITAEDWGRTRKDPRPWTWGPGRGRGLSQSNLRARYGRGLTGFDGSQTVDPNYKADAVTDIVYEQWNLADGTTPATPPATPPVATPPSTVDTLKANILKTTAADEGYVVDPLRKKFEPYIIGGLVAVGVLFLFGMVKVGTSRKN